MAADDASGISNTPKKASRHSDLYDQLQDEFESIIAATEQSKTTDILEEVVENKIDFATFETKNMMDDELSIAMDTMSEADSKSDIAEFDAMAGEIQSTATQDNIEDNITDQLNEEPEPTPFEEIIDSSNSANINKISLSERDLSEENAPEEILQAISGTHQSGQDDFDQTLGATDTKEIDPTKTSDSAFEKEDPVHADISEKNDTQNQGNGRLIALASIVILAAGGGLYWLDTDTDQQKNIANIRSEQVDSVDTASILTAEKQKSMQSLQAEKKTVNVKDSHPATEKTALQRAEIEQEITRKPATKKASIPPQQPRNKAKPSTTVTVDKPGTWVIVLASVNSDKSARQHIARIRAMGVETEAVPVNDNGRIFHHIRVTGFTSKLEAMKRRDTLAKQLGVTNATVERR